MYYIIWFTIVCFLNLFIWWHAGARLVLAPGETSCFPSSILNHLSMRKKPDELSEKKTKLDDFPVNLRPDRKNYFKPTKTMGNNTIYIQVTSEQHYILDEYCEKSYNAIQTVKKQHSYTVEVSISKWTKYTHDVYKCYYYSFAGHILYFKRHVLRIERYTFTHRKA